MTGLNLTNLALVDYFVKGGPFMWVLLACSLTGLAILIYKLFALAITGREESELTHQITALAKQGETAQALALCEGSRSAIIAVLADVLRADGASLWELREEAEMAGARQLALLESGLSMLSVVANVSPLVGFLGTVSGMIRSTFARDIGLNIKLPRALSSEKLPKREVTIWVNRAGQIRLDDEWIRPIDLTPKLKEALSHTSLNAVTIRGDEQVPYGTIVTVMDAAKLLGADITLAAETQMEGPSVPYGMEEPQGQ